MRKVAKLPTAIRPLERPIGGRGKYSAAGSKSLRYDVFVFLKCSSLNLT
jgi:hypothetical protein